MRKSRGASDRDVVGLNRPVAPPSKVPDRNEEATVEQDWVERARTGDASAFRWLVEKYEGRALQLAIGLVKNEHDAHEIVQEAFLRVHRGLPSFEGGASFYTWLYRIVTNLCIDLVRRPFRQRTDLHRALEQLGDVAASMFPALQGTDPVDSMQRAELSAKLQRALDALPPYHREVIVMRELEGMSYQEMAEAIAVSKGTIMSRLFHARQKLQRALHAEYLERRGRAHGGRSKP